MTQLILPMIQESIQTTLRYENICLFGKDPGSMSHLLNLPQGTDPEGKTLGRPITFDSLALLDERGPRLMHDLFREAVCNAANRNPKVARNSRPEKIHATA